MGKFPNLKLREGVKPSLKVSAENATGQTNKEIIHTLSPLGVGGGGGGGGGVKRKTED